MNLLKKELGLKFKELNTGGNNNDENRLAYSNFA